MLLTIELEAYHRPTIAQVVLRRVDRCDALPVTRLPCLGPAPHGTGRRVLDGWPRRGHGRELVEAGERLVLVIHVEVLEARDATVGTEGPEVEKLALERAAADAVDAREHPPGEERTRLEGEDVVVAQGGIVRHVEP